MLTDRLKAGPRTADLAAIAAITAIVAVVYAQLLTHELIVYDDPYFVGNQPHVLGGLSWANFRWAWTTDLTGIWHPLTWLGFQLETELFGAGNDGARFLINSLLHLANALLVYLVSRRLGLDAFNSLLVSLLFAVHPQHVEVVAWLSERKELQATLLVLLSLLLYLLNEQTGSRRAYFWSLALFVCALLSKASAVPLALLLPMVSVLNPGRARRGQPRKALLKAAPYLLAAVIVSILTISLQSHPDAEFTSPVSLVEHLAGMSIRFAWYLQMTLWPFPLSLFHAQPSAFTASELAGAALAIGLFLGLVWRFRSNRLFLLGIAWFLLFLAPTSGIVPLDIITAADRYSYQAHIGLFIALLAIVGRMQRGAGLVRAGLCLAVGVFAILSFNQVGLWKNSVTLMQHQVRLAPDNEQAQVLLAYALLMDNDYDRARVHLDKAIDINSKSFSGYVYLGFLEEKVGRYQAAETAYRTALRYRDPRLREVLLETYKHLVWVGGTLGHHELTVLYLKTGLTEFPDNPYLQEIRHYYRQYYPELSRPLD